MKKNKVYLRRLSLWIFFSAVILCLLVGSAYYFGLDLLEHELMTFNTSEHMMSQVQMLNQRLDDTMLFVLPAAALAVLVLAILLRWILGRSYKKHTAALESKKEALPKKGKKTPEIKEKIIYKVDKNRERLLYSHILAAFQREGQWVDFLNENLEIYEDAQIGAAVRNIQENCKKVLNSHFQLKPVLSQEQGEDITLESGFSPDTIKLVGNVQGEPPFKGVIRHKGWKIQKMDIPDFSGEQDLDILTPAEVEIV